MQKTYEVPVINSNDTGTVSSFNNINECWPGTYTWPSTTTYSYNWSNTIYLYQIICPKPRCKTANWLELDKMKECSKCGSMLKAVAAKADYEIEVAS